MKNYSQQIIDNLRNGARTELIEYQLDDGTVRLTTAGHDITYNGLTYLAGGLFIGVGGIKQEQELRVSTITSVLSLVDQTMLALFQNNSPIGRNVIIMQVLCDDGDQVIGPLLTTTMRIDSYAVDDDEQGASISVTLSNYLAQFDAIRGIRTTQASYQRFFPNSPCFINSKDAGADLKWGGK